MNIVKAHCNMPPYLRLVRDAVKNAQDGKVQVVDIDCLGMAYIRANEYDFLGDVSVTQEALIY